MNDVKRTARGFAIYAEAMDTYGATVNVVESSRAAVEGAADQGPWVWIQIDGEDTGASSHLNPEQARVVRDGLTAFLGDDDREQLAVAVRAAITAYATGGISAADALADIEQHVNDG